MTESHPEGGTDRLAASGARLPVQRKVCEAEVQAEVQPEVQAEVQAEGRLLAGV